MGAGIFISAAVFPIVVLITPSRYARHRHPMDIEDDRGSNEIQSSFDEEDGDESDANAPLLPDGSRRPDPGIWKRFDAWTRRGGVEVERGPFIRDVCFYACAVGGVSLAMTKGSVNRTEAAALVGAYLVYLSVLLVPSRVSALVRHMTRVGVESDELLWENDHTERRLTQGLLDEDDEIDDYAALIEDGAPGMLVPVTTQVADEEYPGEYPGTVSRGDAPSGSFSAQGAEEGAEEGAEGGADTAVVDERTRVSSMTHPAEMTASFLSDGGFTMKRGLRKVTGMLTVVAEAPVVSFIRCTMPDLGSDPARRSRLCTSLLPVTAPLFFVFVERFLGANKLITPAGAVYGAVCGVMGACAMYVAWPHVKYSRVMHGVLTCVAFVMSVTWMDATAGELVSLLTALGKIHGVSETLLGATVLAWGNSVGDIVADVTVAREGHPAMAIAACFAGPLFNLLMGLSAGLAIATETHGDITGIHLENELVVLAGALLVSLAFQAIATPLMHRWRFSRGMAIASLSYYVVFSVVYALISVGVLFPDDWF